MQLVIKLYHKINGIKQNIKMKLLASPAITKKKQNNTWTQNKSKIKIDSIFFLFCCFPLFCLLSHVKKQRTAADSWGQAIDEADKEIKTSKESLHFANERFREKKSGKNIEKKSSKNLHRPVRFDKKNHLLETIKEKRK